MCGFWKCVSCYTSYCVIQCLCYTDIVQCYTDVADFAKQLLHLVYSQSVCMAHQKDINKIHAIQTNRSFKLQRANVFGQKD